MARRKLRSDRGEMALGSSEIWLTGMGLPWPCFRPPQISLLEEQTAANNVKEFVGVGQTPVGIG
jgi:hypothetical protein